MTIYPHSEPKCWARSNRFYESCFYHTPIISRFGCADAIEVQRKGIGIVIEEEDTDKIVKTISTITPDDLIRWQENIVRVSREVYLYTTETDDLTKALKGFAGKAL